MLPPSTISQNQEDSKLPTPWKIFLKQVTLDDHISRTPNRNPWWLIFLDSSDHRASFQLILKVKTQKLSDEARSGNIVSLKSSTSSEAIKMALSGCTQDLKYQRIAKFQPNRLIDREMYPYSFFSLKSQLTDEAEVKSKK